jgi:arylformamidase
MLHDISIPLGASTPEWPGDHPFTCGWTLRREDGESVNLAAITTSLHVGTHADAPVHVHSEWPASDGLELAAFIGDAVVIALPDGHPIALDIDRSLLQALLGDHAFSRVLLRTGYTSAASIFPDDWPALTPDAAAWLVDRGVKLWGVDAPSVDRRHSKTLDVHHALLGRGSFVLENLDLRDIAPGPYELIAPPVAVLGADAAPVRALLRVTRVQASA